MTNRIVITGGTGFLGSSLVKDLIGIGYKCIVLSRTPSKYQNTNEIVYEKWIDDPEYLAKYISNSYAVINLAGSPIAGKRWTKKYKDELINSRVEVTKSIVQAINLCAYKPKLLLSSSASGYYGSRGSEILTEKSGKGSTFLSDVCEKWEKATEELSTEVELKIFRTGVVLHPNDGALKKILIPIRYFVGGKIGTGKQFIPWIHIADWKRFLIFALQNKTDDEIYNLSAPNAETNEVLTKLLGKIYKRPTVFKVPIFVLRIILGELSSVILESQRMEPENIKKTKFIYKYDLLENALKDLKNFQKK